MIKLPWAKNIGIDLGTTNTLVFVDGKGVVVNEPTIVAVDTVSNKIVAIGQSAKDMLGRTPGSIKIYKPLLDGAIADFGITYSLLKYFITKSLGSSSWIKPRILISVPAGISSTEKRALIEAAMKAGARSVVLVKEPILAALGANVAINDPLGSMVMDIGGGTTDVAVISLGGVVASTSVKCAGNKIDQAIIEYIKRKHAIAIGEKTAEQIKCSLASAILIDPDEKGEIKGRDITTGLPKTITITTNEIVKAIDYELKEIIKSLKEVLEQTPPELASDIIDHGVIMTGGTSQLRNLDKLINQHTGVSVVIANDPLFCVSRGAGILLEHMDDYQRSIMSKR